jgi:hypothetical protein
MDSLDTSNDIPATGSNDFVKKLFLKRRHLKSSLFIFPRRGEGAGWKVDGQGEPGRSATVPLIHTEREIVGRWLVVLDAVKLTLYGSESASAGGGGILGWVCQCVTVNVRRGQILGRNPDKGFLYSQSPIQLCITISFFQTHATSYSFYISYCTL